MSLLQPFINLLKPSVSAGGNLPTSSENTYFSLKSHPAYLVLISTRGLPDELYAILRRLGITQGKEGYQVAWHQVQTGLLPKWGALALPEAIMERFRAEPLEATESNQEGITQGYEETVADWDELCNALPTSTLSERCVQVTFTLAGTDALQWQVQWLDANQQASNITEKVMEQGMLIQAKSKKTPYVLLPFWLGQIQNILPALQAQYLTEPKTVIAWLQEVQQWVSQQHPEHAVVLDDKRLSGQQNRTLYFPRFELEARPVQGQNPSQALADIVPFHDSLCDTLGFTTPNEAVTAMQTAFRQWDGETATLRVATATHQTCVDIALSPQQLEAFQFVKTHLTQQPESAIINAMRSTGLDNPLLATPLGLQVFNIDIHHYGERVIGLAAPVKKGGAFSSQSRSLFEGIDEDLSLEDSASAVYVDSSNALQPVVVVNVEGTPVNLDPHLLPQLKQEAKEAYQKAGMVNIPDANTGEVAVVDLKDQSAYEAFAKQLTAATTLWQTHPANPNQQCPSPIKAVEPKPVREDLTKKLALVLQIKSNDDDVTYTEAANSVTASAITEFWQQLDLNPKYTLFPYQEQGILWLVRSFLSGKSGVLLADDMGLGKTLQTLCFIRLLMRLLWQERVAISALPADVLNPATFSKDEPCTNPILIVVPPILLDNFDKQAVDAFQHPEEFQFKVLHGDAIQRYKQANKAHLRGNEVSLQQPLLDIKHLQRTAKCIVITYDTMVNYQYSLGKISWSLILCDEVQKAKSDDTAISRALKAIACKATFKILMSGTPIENNLGELWNIMDIASPGLLHSKRTFAKNYKVLSAMDATEAEKEQAFETLNNTLKFGDFNEGFAIGRLKKDVANNLPELDTQRISVALPAEIKQQITVLVQSEQLGITKPNKVKQLSIHPFLSTTTNPPWQEWLQESIRLQELQRILAEIQAKNEKALIFCEYHRYQAVVQAVANHQSSYGALKAINSEVSDEQRKAILQQFEAINGFAALVLSPKCAGMGLNLQHANHVIHLTRWWNPAVEDQATCRAYRTGQKKPVTVYNFVADHPFEENLHNRLEDKRRLRKHLFDLSYLQEVSRADCLASIGENPANQLPTLLEMDTINARTSTEQGIKFEMMIKEIYQRLGYSVSKLVDKGLDFVFEKDGVCWGVQVKHVLGGKPYPDPSSLERLFGTLKTHQLEKGFFITNGLFKPCHDHMKLRKKGKVILG